jgi:hypothetical protein
MFDKSHYYFPELDGKALSEFVVPFCRLMFAYANLDREIANVVCAATGDLSDESVFKRGSVNGLGRRVEKFIRGKNGNISEIATIKKQINCATRAYAMRNDLAHGHWWRFDSGKKSVSIRRARNVKDRFVEIMVEDIEQAINTFENVEAELFKIRRKFER